MSFYFSHSLTQLFKLLPYNIKFICPIGCWLRGNLVNNSYPQSWSVSLTQNKIPVNVELVKMRTICTWDGTSIAICPCSRASVISLVVNFSSRFSFSDSFCSSSWSSCSLDSKVKLILNFFLKANAIRKKYLGKTPREEHDTKSLHGEYFSLVSGTLTQ